MAMKLLKQYGSRGYVGYQTGYQQKGLRKNKGIYGSRNGSLSRRCFLVLSSCIDDNIVRWAKLRLKRKRTTPYVRRILLEIAAKNAARIVFERLEQA